jgi:hypothetical protein
VVVLASGIGGPWDSISRYEELDYQEFDAASFVRFGYIVERPTYMLTFLTAVYIMQVLLHLLLSMVVLWLFSPIATCIDGNDNVQNPFVDSL